MGTDISPVKYKPDFCLSSKKAERFLTNQHRLPSHVDLTKGQFQYTVIRLLNQMQQEVNLMEMNHLSNTESLATAVHRIKLLLDHGKKMHRITSKLLSPESYVYQKLDQHIEKSKVHNQQTKDMTMELSRILNVLKQAAQKPNKQKTMDMGAINSFNKNIVTIKTQIRESKQKFQGLKDDIQAAVNKHVYTTPPQVQEIETGVTVLGILMYFVQRSDDKYGCWNHLVGKEKLEAKGI